MDLLAINMSRKVWYKIKYVGESFGVDELTNGKVYCAIDDGEDMYRVVDDSDEDYLYDKTNPKPIQNQQMTALKVVNGK